MAPVFAALVMIALAVPVQAQGVRGTSRAKRPPVTWCAKPAEHSDWERRVAYFVLRFAPADTTATQRMLTPVLPFILSGIGRSFVDEHQPNRDSSASSIENLPHGDDRYTPPDLYAGLRFDLRGDGKVDSVVTYGADGSRLKADLERALHATVTRGDVFGPFADSTARTRLYLGVQTDSAKVVRWPAFSLDVPASRPVGWRKGNEPPRYPDGARNWRGSLTFTFEVDEEGRVIPESIQNELPSERIRWNSDTEREVYESFEHAVERALLRMRYDPAQELGCLVRAKGKQQFQFQTP